MSALVEGEHELFGFHTTEANSIVAPIRPKAMPVILTTEAEVDRWLTEETAVALELQPPLPGDALRIVARGERAGPRRFHDRAGQSGLVTLCPQHAQSLT